MMDCELLGKQTLFSHKEFLVFYQYNKKQTNMLVFSSWVLHSGRMCLVLVSLSGLLQLPLYFLLHLGLLQFNLLHVESQFGTQFLRIQFNTHSSLSHIFPVNGRKAA